jgi:Phage integrase family
VLDPAEVEALARAAESVQDAALFRVTAFTGLRLGELRALRRSDVEALVQVRRNFTHGAKGSPKSGLVGSVPLIDHAAKALDGLSRRERFVDPDDLVFVDEMGGHLDDWRLRRRFHDALDKAGLPRLRLHDLRYTFGTIAVQAFPLSDVEGVHGPRRHRHHDGLRPPRPAGRRRRQALPPRRRRRVRAPPAAGFGTRSGHGCRIGRAAEAKSGSVAELSEWARQDSNLGHTDYETPRFSAFRQCCRSEASPGGLFAGLH